MSGDLWSAGPAAGPELRRERSRRSTIGPTVDEVVVVVNLAAVKVGLWLVAGVLIVLDVLVSLASVWHLLPYVVTRFFDGDDKVNFPTAAKTTLLLSCTVLLVLCWAAARRRNDPLTRGWLMLAGVTGFAFVDESTFLHQSLSGVLDTRFHPHEMLHYAWTAVYLPVVALVGVFLLRHLRHLPVLARNRLLPAGALYGLGAIGLEPIKSRIADGSGDDSLAFKATAAVSDSLQLAGLTMLTCTLLVLVAAAAAGFSFAFLAASPAIGPAGTVPGVRPDLAGVSFRPPVPVSPSRRPDATVFPAGGRRR